MYSQEFRNAGSGFISGASGLFQQKETKQTFLMAIVTSAIALLFGRAFTGAQLRDAIDDVLTAQLGPLVGALASPLTSALGIGGVQMAGLTGIATGAFTGIGDKLAALIMPTGALADDAQAATSDLLKAAVAMVAVALGFALIEPKLRELIGQVVEGREFSSEQADKGIGAIIKGVIAYVVIGAIYCIYVRLRVADADADGKCTEAEYDAFFTGTELFAKVFAPVNAIAKLFVAALIPFDVLEEAEGGEGGA